jgi:hypothetical protein
VTLANVTVAAVLREGRAWQHQRRGNCDDQPLHNHARHPCASNLRTEHQCRGGWLSSPEPWLNSRRRADGARAASPQQTGENLRNLPPKLL